MLNQGTYCDDVESITHKEIIGILYEKGISIDVISNEQKLNAGLGITSLEIARLVAILDDKFNVNPFFESVPITSIRTVGDLIEAYQSVIFKDN